MAGPALAVAGYLCVLAVLAYGLLRHVYLAALTVAAPVIVLGVLLALPSSPKGAGGFVIGFLLAPLCTLLMSDRLCRSICLGATPRGAAVSALKEIVAAAGPIIAAYVLALLALVPERPGGWTAHIPDAVIVVLAFVISFGLGAAAAKLDYTEDFIAHANAARERRERLFERPVGLSQTRWSLSITGIALVLAAVALFGLRGLHAQVDWRASAGFAGSAALLAASFAAITRNWRLTVAATLAMALVALLVLWMYARIDPQAVGRFDLWLILFPGLVATSLLVQQMSGRVNRGEDPTSAAALTLREQGPATSVAFAVLAAVAIIVSLLFRNLRLFDFMPAVAGLSAALLFFPAFANTLYRLLPRYRSVDEVFGKR